MIYVEPGNLIFPQHVLTSSGYNTELEAYEQWILGTAKHMYNKSHVDEDVVKEIVKFEMHLAKLMENKPKNERTTVLKLSKKFSTDWSRVFDLIFKGFAKITPNTVITIRNYDYLKNLFLLIDKKGRRVANDYITWAVIKDLSRDTTPHMRNLNFLIDQAVLGVQDDLSREHECLNKIIEYFSPSLVPQYLNSYVNPKVFPKVTAMVASIKTAFIETLLRSDWLSKGAKLLSVEKVKNVQLYLGYSKWHLTGAPLRLYHKLEMTDDHFMNVIKLRYFKTTQELFRLAEKQPRTSCSKVMIRFRWPSTPFEVNAFYSILQNSIFIPLGLLEPPFFHLFGDDTLNYGALGSLIGHELSHSLDPAGILADPTGKITKWWPDRDLDLYKNRIRCFTGANTLAEMISDSNGLRISVTAVKKVAPREKLRRFFMSFAQMWCETSGNTDIFNGEEHPPVWDRVQSLSNNQDFRRAYNCGSAQSCKLW
ncbi:unnamed protein product [Tenebrio molitor]|nr:unnamed protein product [Tenebrio molitor]